MPRSARIPHTGCGVTRVDDHLDGWSRRVVARALMAAIALLVTVLCGPDAIVSRARAQDPSLKGTQASNKAFPKQPGGILGPAPKIDKALPLNLEADQLIYDTRNNRVVARGNVQIFYNGFVLTADQVIYDQTANKLIAEGNAQIKDPNGQIVRGERLETTDDLRDAFIQKLSVTLRDDTKIAAQRASRREGNVTEFEEAKFTPCKNDPGKPPLWCVTGARIVHDQQAATITYQDATFELWGVPVFYLPYFQHADPSVKRRSGFLAPSILHSSNLGLGLEVPYYFALAQNYDFLFNPTYYSKQGVLYQGTWRHRLENGEYIVKLAAIDQDGDNLPGSITNRDRLNGFQGTLETRGQFSLSSWWRYGWDVTIESSDYFRRFYKFDSILQTDRVNVGYLTGLSDRNYFNASLYHFGGLLLDDTVQAGSKVMPVIDYNYIFAGQVLGGELGFNAHARNMERKHSGTDSTHAVAELNWRSKIVDGIGQVWTPFAHARGDVYAYSNARDPDSVATQNNDTDTFGFGAAGVTYSYPFVAHTGSASHVIAPTAQIIARPNHAGDQRKRPDEDAKSLIFDDTLLFDVDKFSGFDRLETGTRANVGMQYTFQTNGGLHARIVGGQSFHLSGENPYANPGFDPSATSGTTTSFTAQSGLETTKSDYVLGAYLSPITGLALIAQGRFDDRDLTLRRQDSLITAGYGPFNASLAYSFTRADPSHNILKDQQDILAAVGLKLSDRWSAQVGLRYDIDDHRRVQDSFTLKYADECFVLTATYTETFIQNELVNDDRTIMLRFELKHLGEFNYKSDNLSNIFGENQPQIPR